MQSRRRKPGLFVMLVVYNIMAQYMCFRLNFRLDLCFTMLCLWYGKELPLSFRLPNSQHFCNIHRHEYMLVLFHVSIHMHECTRYAD